MKKWDCFLKISLVIVLCSVIALGSFVKAENVTLKDEEPLVTAVFFDSDLREALKEVSLQTGTTIVMDENIKGVVTMDLKEVSLEKALRMMVSGGGYMFRKIEDYYIVGLPDPKNPTFALLCETGIYYFRNINVESAKALLPEIYKGYVQFDNEKNMATINAPSSILKTILTDLEMIDGTKKLIQIKTLVTEVSTDSIKEFGTNLLKFSSTEGDYFRSATFDIGQRLITLEGVGSFGTVLAEIKLLSEKKKATVQADPVVVVTEGKTAQLFVGDKKTIILQTEDSSYSNQSETVEAGISLKVTPRVYSDYLELAINQKVSGIEQEEKDRILVKTREFDSVVRLASGHTMMIAGLTEKQSKNAEQKTPLLGDIPIVRFFFKEKKSEQFDSQMLIFLTAEVLN